MPDTYIGGMQGAVFNTILEVRVIDMVDHCGQGLFHHIAWQNRPIQIITVGAPGYLGIWEYLLDIPGTPSPDQQFIVGAVLAYDGQVAVVRHYPHLISRRVVSDLLITWTALPTTSAGRFSPLGPLGEDDPFRFKNLVNSMDDFRDGVVRSPESQQVMSCQSDSICAQRFCRTHCGVGQLFIESTQLNRFLRSNSIPTLRN